jgi:hypothetical protein
MHISQHAPRTESTLSEMGVTSTGRLPLTDTEVAEEMFRQMFEGSPNGRRPKRST